MTSPGLWLSSPRVLPGSSLVSLRDLGRVAVLPAEHVVGVGRRGVDDPPGLSSGLIRRSSGAFAEHQARPPSQVTDHADLAWTDTNRLGKRVGCKPSRVRISHPPHAMLTRQDSGRLLAYTQSRLAAGLSSGLISPGADGAPGHGTPGPRQPGYAPRWRVARSLDKPRPGQGSMSAPGHKLIIRQDEHS
jgi:hypothetical protein